MIGDGETGEAPVQVATLELAEIWSVSWCFHSTEATSGTEASSHFGCFDLLVNLSVVSRRSLFMFFDILAVRTHFALSRRTHVPDGGWQMGRAVGSVGCRRAAE